MAGYRKLRSHISPNRFMKVPTHVPGVSTRTLMQRVFTHRAWLHTHARDGSDASEATMILILSDKVLLINFFS